MSYSVTIKNGLADIALPGGTIAQGGQTYTLTDDQYLALSPTAAAALFSSSSQTGGAGAGAWSIDPTAYGAKGDGQISITGSMTAGSAILTISESAFTVNDEGKYVSVKGAGPTGVTTLIAKILNFVDAQHVQLDTNAATTVPSGAQVLWATDDTAAIQAALDAAVSYGLMHSYTAILNFPAAQGLFYGVAGALKTGGTTLGNAQITLPVVPSTGNKLTLVFQGPADASAVRHWEQDVPQTNGATLVSFYVHASTTAQVNSINAGGNSAVIGGPAQPGGYGTSALAYSNVNAVFRDFSILTSHSAYGLTLTALDLSGMANAALDNFSYGTTGIVPSSTDLTSPGVFSTGLSIGLLMPASGNNDNCIIRNVTCSGGYTYGIFATEHCDIYAMRILYCWAAFCPVGSYYSSAGSTHAITATLLSIEACTYLVYIIGAGSSGTGPFLHLRIDTETSTPRFGDNNGGTGSAAARGDVVLTGLYTTGSITLDHPVGYEITDGQRSYGTITITGNYTVNPTDQAIMVNATSGAVTVTLPTAVGHTRSILVAKTDSSANAVTVQPQAGQTINGATSKTHGSQWSSGEYFPTADGTWFARLI